MLAAARLAVDEINAAGGVGERQLRLEVEDDSAQTTRAIAIAGWLRDSTDVIAVVGHLTSGTTITHARLGVTGRTLTAAQAKSLGVPQGVAVAAVEPGSGPRVQIARKPPRIASFVAFWPMSVAMFSSETPASVFR